MSYAQQFFYMVLSLASAFFGMEALGYLLSFKKQWWKRLILFFGCWLLTGMIIFIGDWGNLPPTILIFLFCVWFCCEGSALQKITIGLMFASTGFAFNALVDNFISSLFDKGMLIRPLFWLILYYGIRHFAPEEDYELSPSLWKLLLVLTLTPLGIVLACVLLSTDYRIYSFNLHYFALLLIALTTFVGLLWAITVLAKQAKLEQEHMLTEVNRRYYEEMERQHFEIRRLKHDLTNHLQALAVLTGDDKIDYIQKLLSDAAITQTLKYAGDSTVNAVLSSKETMMKDHNIRFHVKVEIPTELPFEKPDLCAVFANALDNAIEACLKQPAEKREITLAAKVDKGLFVLKIKNPADNDIDKTGTFPKTTKKDSFHHGIGLKSIQKVVKRYNGQMELNPLEDCFELFLYLPIPESTKTNDSQSFAITANDDEK